MDGAELIANERKRQIEAEGYTSGHDKLQKKGELSIAAACYALHGLEVKSKYHNVDYQASMRVHKMGEVISTEDAWPWDTRFDKRDNHDRIRRLTIAGALIAAEIDRLLQEETTEITKDSEG